MHVIQNLTNTDLLPGRKPLENEVHLCYHHVDEDS